MHGKRNTEDSDGLKTSAIFLQTYGMQKRKPKKNIEDKGQLRT